MYNESVVEKFCVSCQQETQGHIEVTEEYKKLYSFKFTCSICGKTHNAQEIKDAQEALDV